MGRFSAAVATVTQDSAHPSPLADLLETHSPEIRVIVSRLRHLVKEIVPQVKEQVKVGWHSISFRHPRQGYFCGIFPRTDHVLFLFEYGILLPDADNILEGDGKQVRYVKVYAKEEIDRTKLMELVTAALALPEKRSEKLAMIAAGTRPGGK